MNILFLTIGGFENINHHDMYPDILRHFAKNGHNVYIVSSNERRNGEKTLLINDENVSHIKVRIGNITKCCFLEKGISTLLIGLLYKNAINKYFSNVAFDIILYATPPVTIASLVKNLKEKYNAFTYLMLKDIFPQNAVDLGLISKTGIRALIYHYFRKQEIKLYQVSDRIGCMSQANFDYVIKHNRNISLNKLQICPNSTDVIDMSCTKSDILKIRKKYDIPIDKKVFVYGGNLGKPQGIPFLLQCMKTQINNDKAFFLIIGNGTEYDRIAEYIQKEKQCNLKLISKLPKDEYDKMIGSCDVGLIFLDHRFTIPNFPSRLLAYMKAKLPVLAVTDPNTDIGNIIVNGGFGWWCESNDVSLFSNKIHEIIKLDLKHMKDAEFIFLKNNYSSEMTYKLICRAFENEKT